MDFQEKRELIKLTSIAFNGMSTNVQEQEMRYKMVTELKNIANAVVQKNDTFKLLVAANKALIEALQTSQDKFKKLLTIITALFIKSGGKSSGGADRTKVEPREATTRGIHRDIVVTMDSKSRSGTASQCVSSRSKATMSI